MLRWLRHASESSRAISPKRLWEVGEAPTARCLIQHHRRTAVPRWPAFGTTPPFGHPSFPASKRGQEGNQIIHREACRSIDECPPSTARLVAAQRCCRATIIPAQAGHERVARLMRLLHSLVRGPGHGFAIESPMGMSTRCEASYGLFHQSLRSCLDHVEDDFVGKVATVRHASAV